MDKHLVSVIVPVYKVEAYIEKCIRSLFEQTYENIEFIFVDDASPDNSIEIIKEVLKNYPKREDQTKIITHEINKGLPSARNTGLANAKGDYIYHCDSDDWVDTQIIEKLLQKAISDNADVVFCDIYNVYDNSFVLYQQSKCDSYKDYIENFFYGYSQGSVWNKLIKSNLYYDNKIKFPDGLPMLEDLRTIVQIYYYAEKISYVNKPLYFYVKSRSNSISGSQYQKSNKISLDRIENVKEIERFLKNKNVEGLELSINLLKLGAKHNLLINAKSIRDYKIWKDIFPESSVSISKSSLPFYYKIIAKSITSEIWILPFIWLKIKKLIKK